MDLELMINSFPKLLNAAVITLKLLSVSLIIGLFIGLFFAILRLNKNIFINRFAYGYSYVFRGTPLLVQIFVIYFATPVRSIMVTVLAKEVPFIIRIISFP